MADRLLLDSLVVKQYTALYTVLQIQKAIYLEYVWF